MNDLGLFVSINMTANLKAQLKCLFFLPSSEEIAVDLLYDSHSFQLTIQIAYYFLQPMSFFGRTDAKAETPVLWPPHAKS